MMKKMGSSVSEERAAEMFSNKNRIKITSSYGFNLKFDDLQNRGIQYLLITTDKVVCYPKKEVVTPCMRLNQSIDKS